MIFRCTLNNVILGIALMAAVGLYIAVGSGLPSVRAHFEMNELEFFDAWPLKVLMLLLCINLAVVTWNRIPLTPPRYGVWCIHCGIITLIAGTSFYYHRKIEGRTLIPLNRTAVYFYDTGQRALYAHLADRPVYGVHVLPSLPRFGDYDDEHDPARLQRRDLSDIERFHLLGTPGGGEADLSAWLGLLEKVRLDIVGFYAYGDVDAFPANDPSSNDVGVELKIASPHDPSGASLFLSCADPSAARQVLDATELQHRQVSQASLEMIRQALGSMFRLTAALGQQTPVTLNVELGKTYGLPGGYSATIDSFDPAFPMFGTHEIAQALTVHLKNPQGEFWRMILAGRTLQTDFKLDPATTPPMLKGNRQKEPIDKELVLGFSLSDPADLMPSQGGQEKHTLLTAGDHGLFDVHTSLTSAAQMRDLTGGDGQIELLFEGSAVPAQVRRVDHIRMLTRARVVPPALRQQDEAESGIKQIVVVRVTAGKWSQEVAAPCNLYAAPDPMSLEPFEPWNLGTVRIPGASSALQLQLGFAPRPLPASLTLKNFELVHYPGGQGDNGPYRDFRSTLQIRDESGETSVAVASDNNPVYYDGGRWIFFQAGYDPEARFSVIGVGNRPGVGIMITGCVMIVAGLLYAFYVKPIITRRLKAAPRQQEAVAS